jgi:DNA-binding Lrp family transcriptional regulator
VKNCVLSKPDIPNELSASIDDIDRRIIVATQGGLPLVSEPYQEVASQVGISKSEVIRRMQSMLDVGIIRRMGAVPNHYALGYKSNGMTVWDVPDERMHELGSKLGALDFVSHCYHRPRHLPFWPYNLFAMVHGCSRDEVYEQVRQIEHLLGDDDNGHDILFSTRILKKTGLRLSP